jgi:hypothetical protein
MSGRTLEAEEDFRAAIGQADKLGVLPLPPALRRGVTAGPVLVAFWPSRKIGRVLGALNGWHRDPFTHRPDVVGQARGHRR